MDNGYIPMFKLILKYTNPVVFTGLRSRNTSNVTRNLGERWVRGIVWLNPCLESLFAFEEPKETSFEVIEVYNFCDSRNRVLVGCYFVECIFRSMCCFKGACTVAHLGG